MPSYTLEKIRAFADHDEESMRLILLSFVQSTQQNIKRFKQHLQQHDEQSLADLAHKMLPMFKQLEAHTVIEPLTKLEEQQVAHSDSKAICQTIISQVEILVNTIIEEHSLGE